MTLKLTIQQAEALERLFTEVVIQDSPGSIEEKLVHMLMIRVYKKLRNKLEARLKGSGYSISLTDEEAMAYYVYFKDRYLGDAWLYETNAIHAQIATIDKQYA